MTGMQKRVLIVDDEEDLTWTLARKLSKDQDKFQLITVNSGREAKEVLSQLPVDLVITDVRMPEVSGLELLEEIKNKYPQTKVVIMTAYGSTEMQRTANELGCFHYIEKPFEINELRELILDALKEKKGFKGNVSDFQLGDIIQLNCLGRITSALHVTTENETGIIYFHEGNIVHAETDRLEGENAFYYIMSWKGGEFSVKRNVRAPRETIHKGWQGLLLEGLRRLDESSESAVEEKERQRRERNEKMKAALEPILKSAGVEFVLVHTRAGFPITYLPDTEEGHMEAVDLGNHLSSFFTHVGELQRRMQTTGANFMELHFEDLTLIIIKVPESDAYISVVGEANTNIGFIRLELRRAVKTVKELV